MDELMLDRLRPASDTITLRESEYRAHNVSNSVYVANGVTHYKISYTYTELYSDGVRALRVTVKRGQSAYFARASVEFARLDMDALTWRALDGGASEGRDWYAGTKANSQYAPPPALIVFAKSLAERAMHVLCWDV